MNSLEKHVAIQGKIVLNLALTIVPGLAGP